MMEGPLGIEGRAVDSHSVILMTRISWGYIYIYDTSTFLVGFEIVFINFKLGHFTG
jgi:hypothetical protein